MRSTLTCMAAVLTLCLAPSFANAQFHYSQYGGWTTPTPYYVPGPYSYTQTYVSPYGHRSAYTTGVYPTPYGSNTFSFYRQQVRPVYAGPYHSMYYDPYTLGYRQGPGFRNTPQYHYRFGY